MLNEIGNLVRVVARAAVVYVVVMTVIWGIICVATSMLNIKIYNDRDMSYVDNSQKYPKLSNFILWPIEMGKDIKRQKELHEAE